MYLQSIGHISTGDILLDSDIRDHEIVTLADGTYLYTSTGGNGGLTAYRLSASGLATEIDRQYFNGTTSNAAGGIVTAVSMNGSMQLIFGGAGDDQLLGYALDDGGDFLNLMQTGSLATGTAQISAVAAADVGGSVVIYVADEGTGQLVAYGADGAGGIQAPGGGQSSYAISGPTQLETVTIGGQEYLLATDTGIQGVISYRVLPGSGALEQTDVMGSTHGLGVNTPTAMEVVRAHGETWVILGAAGSSSISVMQMDSSGELTPVDHVIDTLNTRFDDVQSLSVVEVDGWVFVVAGGADDGLTLFTLLPDGRLVHRQTLPHTTGAGLANVGDISAARIGNEIQVFVSSATDGGLTQFSIPLDDMGNVIHGAAGGGTVNGTPNNDMLVAGDDGASTLSGGAGDDILVAGAADVEMRGGGGADRFVLHADARNVTITDFRAGTDRIDLSDYPMLRSPGQLTITSTGYGARIEFRDNVIEVHSATGGLLDADDLFGPSFDWPDRVLILPPPPGDVIIGGAGGEALGGTELDDTIQGNGGADTLSGLDGDDSLEGGDGNDELFGGAGNDYLSGDNGADMLDGGAGNDTLNGGSGSDTLNGSHGNDSLIGGGNNDELIGADGQDTLLGGGGNDALWGGAGNDSMVGGTGDDTLGGADGNDSLWGGDGDDEIWGAGGNDTGWGGAGNDTLGGGNGNDTLYGEAGHDLVWGGHQDDLQYGGDGNDTVGGFSGNDTLRGGNGDDKIWGNTGNDIGYGDAGNDTLGGFDGNDTLYGGAGDDSASGGDGDDQIFGGDGHDILQGRNGRDGLWGGAGNDTMEGGNGDDTLGGGDGNDSLSGNVGNDEIWGAGGADIGWGGWGHDTLGGGNGNDTLYGDAGNDLVWGGHQDDLQYGGDGNDTVGGFSGDDTLHGGNGDDKIWGNTGDDIGYGDAGNDTLGGYYGDDTLYGGAGDDLLLGSDGNDVLWGGTGADTFQFAGNHGNDEVMDFEPGNDVIALPNSGLSFHSLNMTQAGEDVVLTLAHGQITLHDVTLAELSADDFLF